MDSDASLGIVLVTAASQEEAVAIAQALVTQKLAACVNMFPVQSVYVWDGAVQQDSEWQLVIKTNLVHWDALAQLIHRLHSYDVPELIAVPIVQGSEAYLAWMTDMTHPS